MALNPFFLQGSPGEQRLVQELINEQLKIYGVEVTYIPRKIIGTDPLLGYNDLREVNFSKFDDNYSIEAYVQNYEGYGGSGDILTKFGMSLRDEVTLVISRERYEDFIAQFLTGLPTDEIIVSSRPREGDLIYFPLGQRLFEVKFVEHENPFYQLGKNYVYELKCELYEYEDEIIDTSIEEIDTLVKDQGYITTLIVAGLGETATASASLNSASGYIRKIYLNDDGTGYTSTPTVSISPSPIGSNATAVAITTSKGGVLSVSEILIVNAGSGYTKEPTITISGGGGAGAAATCSIERIFNGVQSLSLTNAGSGYPIVPLVTISAPVSVGAAATVGMGTTGAVVRYTLTAPGQNYNPNKNPVLTFSSAPSGGSTASGYAVVGASGTVTALIITRAGYGYTVTPTVSIGNTFADKIGLNTAVAVAYVNSATQVSGVRIVNPGNGYTSTPTVVIANPPRIRGIGNYQFNELIVGQNSKTTGRVKSWDADTRILKVGINSGTFYAGEDVVGAASSAIYVVSSYDQSDIYDAYAENDEIENIADQIVDFSESNPFGVY
jgi:hypothetical protein